MQQPPGAPQLPQAGQSDSPKGRKTKRSVPVSFHYFISGNAKIQANFLVITICLMPNSFSSVGKSKTVVVNACRQAIKSNNINALTKIIRSGTT